MKRTRIVLVASRPGLRWFLEQAIQREPHLELAASLEDVWEGVATTLSIDPDVLFLDVERPHTDGIAAVRQLRRSAARAGILMAAVENDPKLVEESLRVGVHGFLCKRQTMPRWKEAIEAVGTGRIWVNGRIVDRVDADLRRLAGRAAPQRRTSDTLTPTEYEILLAVSRGLTTKQIARQRGVSYYTVRNQISDILEKLEVQNRAQAVAVAVERGVAG